MALSAAEREEFLALDQEIARRKATGSLREFSQAAWAINEGGDSYVDGWHIHAICEHLEAVARGQIRNLLINMPPRHMKSSLVSVLFPAWVWTWDAPRRFMYASYAQSLSTRDSVKSRNIIESAWYKHTFKPSWKLADDQNAKQKYVNTAGGYRISTSVGGAVTGEGGDIIVADDPHNVTEAISPAMRQEALDFWDKAITSRGNNPKTVAKIVVMQRVHEKDLSGHLLAKGGYEHLCLPAEYRGKKYFTSIGWEDPRKVDGELLWPTRFGPEEIQDLKKGMGANEAAGQLDQLPVAAGGAIVQTAWWRYWKVLPEKFDLVIDSWDLTFEETEKGAYVVGQKWGRVGPDKYLLSQVRQRMGFTEQIPAVLNLLQSREGTHGVLVEKAANGAALLSVLKTMVPGLVPIQAKGSKSSRAEAVSIQIQSGNVYLPDPEMQDWVTGFIQEWAAAPNGEYWDQIDAASQALTRLGGKLTFSWNPSSMIQESKWRG